MKKHQFVIHLFCLFLMSSVSDAASPTQMQYRAILKNTASEVLTGTHSVTFSLYDTATGGVSLWQENKTVQVVNGDVNVLLGETVSLDSLDFNNEYWLELNVNGETLNPRQKLAAVPYAHNAMTLNGKTESELNSKWLGDPQGAIYYLNGRVGIGTDSPTYALHVNQELDPDQDMLGLKLKRSVPANTSEGSEYKFYLDDLDEAHLDVDAKHFYFLMTRSLGRLNFTSGSGGLLNLQNGAEGDITLFSGAQWKSVDRKVKHIGYIASTGNTPHVASYVDPNDAVYRVERSSDEIVAFDLNMPLKLSTPTVTWSGDYLRLVGEEVRISEKLMHDGDLNTFMRFDSDRIRFNVGSVNTLLDLYEGSVDEVRIGQSSNVNIKLNNDKIYISGTTGNVGIGTQVPLRKLHVNDAVRLQPLTTEPINPDKGDLYFDNQLNKLRCFDGTSWQNCF